MFSLRIHSCEEEANQRTSMAESTSTTTSTTTFVAVEDLLKGLNVSGEEDNDSEAYGPTKAVRFSSGNPRVEEIRGVMHLYRNVWEPPGALESLPAGRSRLVCVLAVPNYMTYADFCQFSGSFIQNILEMRIVRNDGLSDRYSILMTFDNQKSADDFYRHYNRKPFSSLESEYTLLEGEFRDAGEFFIRRM
eukprot:Gb_37690 [translate_table: standard]